MGKTALLFPGQGSQTIGMGSDIIGGDTFTQSLFNCASELLHEDLIAICLNGPMKRLMQARFLQPALVAVCLGYWNRLIHTITPDYIVGHSLGEITSLAAAGVVTPEDCLRIATKRGELMDAVAASCNGGMMAVMFTPLEKIESLLQSIGEPERLVLANDNAPEQIVLSGDVRLLERFAAQIVAKKLGKCRRVEVIGPWHSPYMKEARDIFERWVAPVIFNQPKIPIIFNATSLPEDDPQKIKHLVTGQLVYPVFWRTSMETLRHREVDTLFEIGPQRILSGLARINGFKKGSHIFNINNLRGVERALQAVNTISS